MQNTPLLVAQDLSAATSISLNVAIPVYASLGIPVVAMPTTLLSTQTGAFGQPETLNLDQWIDGALSHWRQSDIRFSGMAIGYVGSEALVAKLDHYLENNPVPFVVIDPVMGDHGTLYAGFNQSYVEQIRQLSHRADVLTPNWTEAQLLVGDNPSSEATEQRISEVLNRLTEQAKPHALIVITGIHLANSSDVWWQDGHHLRGHEQSPLVAHHFDGTGDLFAAIVTGLLTLDWQPEAAVRKTVELMQIAIKETVSANRDFHHGMVLKQLIAALAQL